MDAYPPLYVEHNLPLVLLSGLGKQEDASHGPEIPRQESGARILTDSIECRTEQSRRLLDELLAQDGSQSAWNGNALPGPSGTIKYLIKTIGRSYTLPARKAAPQPQEAGSEGGPLPRNTELHSPISPLSPGSPIFPDGIFTPQWFSKHQQQVPALFLAFFNLNANEASQDEQTKADINAIRGALTRSGFKTRFAVVLISDKSILHAPDIEDRLGSIRRATTLDPKTGLFFMPPMSSQNEIATFAQDTMRALQPSVIEYYRDLTKHARRKKARGGPPPSTQSLLGGASQSTSTSAWNVRYEFKQGVFGECRQEMDVAERHYSTAIEELFSSEGGVLETTHSWSPRFDEARLLCDITAIRLARCQLWSGQTTAAAQSWQNYKLRMKDLIDRRGKGSSTYSWDAWEARWSAVMAELIHLSDIPTLRRPSAEREGGALPLHHAYAPQERPTAAPDRMPPYNFLHHPGYWLRLLAKAVRNRWEKADAIPDEDRVPPGQSPASAVASRAKTYDVYLVPEPHQEAAHDHATELAIAHDRAAQEFDARQQLRMSQQIRLELAEDLVKVSRYDDALQVLSLLWESSAWRGQEWRTPFGRLLRLLSDCASRDKSSKNAALIPALTWELITLAPVDMPDATLDLVSCLDAWEVDEKIDIRMEGETRLSPIRATFAFRSRESHVGENLECQLVLQHTALATSGSIRLSRLELDIGSKPIVIQHTESLAHSDKEVTLTDLSQAEETDGPLDMTADLRIRPGQTKILRISVHLREARLYEFDHLHLTLDAPKFTLSHRIDSTTVSPGSLWYFDNDGTIDGILIPHMDTKTVNILPKPPKMQLRLHGLRQQYYTDEVVSLTVELLNEEDEAVHATLVPAIVGTSGDTLSLRWVNGGDEVVRTVNDLDASALHKADLTIHGPAEAASFMLSIELRYTLISDTNTPLTKTMSVEVPFVTPFEVKFTFAPRLHHSPWPSYFNANQHESAEKDKAQGIAQLWRLGAHIASSGSDVLNIQKLQLLVNEVQGNCTCNISKAIVEEQQDLPPRGKTISSFDFTTQKLSLDDRQASSLNLSLQITWSHSRNNARSSTTITVPRLPITTVEPRVLCTVTPDSDEPSQSARLTYHLENPSTHFLTFALTMEATEDFAFSGLKHRALSLAPLSRHRVEYDILLHKEFKDGNSGCWISPNLQVMDSYYRKTLRVHPGDDRVKLDDRKEVAVWVGAGEAP